MDEWQVGGKLRTCTKRSRDAAREISVIKRKVSESKLLQRERQGRSNLSKVCSFISQREGFSKYNKICTLDYNLLGKVMKVSGDMENGGSLSLSCDCCTLTTAMHMLDDNDVSIRAPHVCGLHASIS